METLESALTETTAEIINEKFGALSNFFDWVIAIIKPIGVNPLAALIFFLIIVTVLSWLGFKK